MENKDLGKESENSTKQFIVVIDDNPENISQFGRDVTNIPGLEVYYVTPNKLNTVPDEVKKSTILVLADQHLHKAVPVMDTKHFLQDLSKTNTTYKVIEISYSLQEQAYEQSIGMIDTLSLKTGFHGEIKSWPRTKDGFLMKLKWKGNSGFNFANDLEKQGDDLPAIVERSYKNLINSMHFQKLLSLAAISQNEFTIKYEKITDLRKKAEVLHEAWQTIGHFMMENGADYYGLTLQRFKQSL